MTPIWILLLLQLRLTREEDAYVQKGQDQVFPCGPVEPPLGRKEVTWSYNTGVPGSSSVLLFQGVADQPLKKEAGERLSVFPNHSLYLQGAEDGDMGTYWCSVQGVTRHTYQLNVVTETQTVLTTGPTNMTCHQVSCMILDRQALPAVTWWVGEQRVQDTGGQQVQDTDGQGWQLVFSGSRAALLQACWNRSDPGARKKRRVRCELNSMRVTFDLTGAVKDPPSCSSAWIPLAVCAALEFLLLLALGVALWWRGRLAQRSHLGDLPAHTQPEPPGPKSQMQLYENVGLGYAAGGADPAQL
ncbi:lymphocyte antigen 6 complex locus protein G6f-like isoform X1 [Gopherus evgoodei]|uniref:lymphocyte antigen 6 complex locus protein G6f-like isoform X1 n=1 Tax=Gopherus evgoodei TaxID=1825980 RepID=UPI0011CEFB88|nr:lymphocyte antigen 6 complex locus protein G6f-like isoform X1 [Gopherus evgoodei]